MPWDILAPEGGAVLSGVGERSRAIQGTTGLPRLAFRPLLVVAAAFVALELAVVALLNKHNVLFLLGALGVALLLTRREALRGPWPWIGAALALAIWSPNILWNAQHD